MRRRRDEWSIEEAASGSTTSATQSTAWSSTPTWNRSSPNTRRNVGVRTVQVPLSSSSKNRPPKATATARSSTPSRRFSRSSRHARTTVRARWGRSELHHRKRERMRATIRGRRPSQSAYRSTVADMRAWTVMQPGPIDGGPLRLGTRRVPDPGPAEVLVEVAVCGVCRTDLHVTEGDLPVHRPSVVPGHEIVGRVVGRGPGAERFAVGERIGIPWLRHTCGTCRFCRRGDENLCVAPGFTGWDDDGGYAEYATVEEAYAYRLPDMFDDERAAPLLCAGIIGYRALERAGVPEGGRLGVYGFGGSAHLAAQIAIHRGVTVHVMTRSTQAQRLALSSAARPPRRLTHRRPSRGAAPNPGPPPPRGAAPPPPGPPRPASPFPPRRWPRAGRARRPRPGRHAGDRRHPPEPDPAARLPGPPLRGAAGPQRHREHPRRRRGVPGRGGRRGCAGAHHAVPARSRRPGPRRPGARPGRRGRGAAGAVIVLRPAPSP